MFQSLTLPSNPILQLPIPSHRPQMMRCRAAVQSFAEPAGLFATRKPASFYEVLRVKQNASPIEIKAAYRTLAKLYHPDATAASESDGRDFIQIHNAYETLSDPSARAIYDLSLGLGRDRRLSSSSSSSSFGCYSVGRRPTRRWETDQCW